MFGVAAGRLSIGEFSRRTQLTSRALRHYDDIGVLRPAVTNPDTGYRYYEPDQVIAALWIRQLRDLGLSLEAIGKIVSGSLEDDELFERLIARRDELAAAIAADQARMDLLDHWISRRENDMIFNISTRHVRPASVATFRWRGPAAQATAINGDQWLLLAEAVAAVDVRLCAMIGFANAFDGDGLADLELGFVTEELIPPGENYTARVVDGGLFASLTFDSLLDKGAAYLEMERWLDSSPHERRGPSRELSPLLSVFPNPSKTATIVEPSPSGWPTEILVPID